MPEPTYDLAAAAADYPAWNGPPRRTVVICSHPRSGSTLLGEALYMADLGAPLEYYHAGFRPTFQARWGAASLDDYAASVRRFRTTRSGVHGLKLFWMDVEDLAHERDPDGQPPRFQRPPKETSAEDYRRMFALIQDLLPNPTFVHLRRQDRVRQAISQLSAAATGRWRSIDGQDRAPAAAPAYDYERIHRIIGAAAYAHAHWANLFAALGAAPYPITYEALARDYEGAVGALLRRLDAPRRDVRPPRMRQQSEPASEAMALRFVKEDNACQPG